MTYVLCVGFLLLPYLATNSHIPTLLLSALHSFDSSDLKLVKNYVNRNISEWCMYEGVITFQFKFPWSSIDRQNQLYISSLCLVPILAKNISFVHQFIFHVHLTFFVLKLFKCKNRISASYGSTSALNHQINA